MREFSLPFLISIYKPPLASSQANITCQPQTIHFLKTIKEPRLEDYNIRYRYGNRFAFLGNGEVKANTTGDVKGLSTYVRDHDHDWDVE